VLKKYLKKKKLPTIDVVKSVPAVEKRVVKDIPVLGEEGLHVLDKVGTYLTMIIEGCEACHKCVKVCPNDALSMEDNRVMIRTDLCDGAHCQKCIHACPHDLFKWENLDVMMQEPSMEQ
jgi:ferredoxin